MPKKNRKCKKCSKKFYAKPNWIKRGYGVYCSKECQHSSQRNGKIVNCHICNKEVYRSKSALDKSKSGKYFCSRTCQTKWRNEEVFVGENHSNWKHGKGSYRKKIIRSDKERICKMCNIRDKRVLLVHHVDWDRKNNNLDNLVWLCCNCHKLVHNHKQEKAELDKILKR